MSDQPPAEVDDDDFYDDDGDPLLVFELADGVGNYLVVGSGEWSGLSLGQISADVRVRLHLTPRGIVITGVAVLALGDPSDPWPLAATDLREVPLTQLQALLDHPRWGSAVRDAMRHATYGGSDMSPGEGSGADGVAWGERQVPAPPRNYVIAGTNHPSRPPWFYDDVAAAWTAARASGAKNPAAVLAEANGVPITTIHRWVRVARERGVLAPSSRSSPRQTEASLDPR